MIKKQIKIKSQKKNKYSKNQIKSLKKKEFPVF